MSAAQHVWARDGNVQSCHWRLMNSVDGRMLQVFPATFTDAVTTTPFLTFPYGFFFDVLVFS